ncbi:hypothetical protein BDB01DRAFT_717940 [Pilobolus umbonatus]|nr:hypothetical protein BDB01DRAFT_717940 [Pilobolus umbonatus]
MATNFTSGSRVADYFFVAGVHDDHIIPAFESAKKHRRFCDNDHSYYQQQEAAVANNGANYKYDMNDSPIDVPHNIFPGSSASLLGVLDHVQSVIDNFDKERDSARDNVIAVHDLPSYTHKYRRTESEKTITHRSKPIKTWRSVSEPKVWTSDIMANLQLESSHTPNILDIKYTPTILMRYPNTNYSAEEPFPAYAAMAMTDENGSTIYGTCLVFHEKLPQKLWDPVNKTIQDWVSLNMEQSTVEYAHHLLGKITAEQQTIEEKKTKLHRQRSVIEDSIKTCQENIDLYKELLEPVKMAVCDAKDIWVPKCIGLLGKMPWMNLYGDWIKILVDKVVGVGGHKHLEANLDIYSSLVNLIDEVPLPPPGRFEIGLTIDKKSLFFSRPAANQVPILKNTLLSEGKVVFLSKYPGMLSVACESFRYLMFPFYWQFVFIPVLPERLLTCLQAPVPFIIGFQGSMDDLYDHVSDDTCIVNLDSNTMHQTERSILIPERQRRKLQAALEQYAPLHTRCKIPYGVPITVQQSYPRGKMILNCNRSTISDAYVSPAHQHRKSESSDGTSIWSHNASVISKPSEFWSTTGSTRTSDESSISLGDINSRAPHLPQFPGLAMLSTSVGNYSTSSKSSINSLPMNHIHPTLSMQSSLSNSSATSRSNPNRVSSTSTPITAASPPTTTSIIESEHSYYKPATRISESSSGRTSSYKYASSTHDHDKTDMNKNKLATFMSKPKAVFQHEQPEQTNYAVSPRLSVSASTPNQMNYDRYNNVPRRIKYIEGHIMAEIFIAELDRFHGYRCVCGKEVSEREEFSHKRPRMFMCCQECHLITHDTCTDEILHPCLPACFDEKKVCNAFIRMFASLLYNYRSGFVEDSETKSNSNITANDNRGDGKRNLVFSKDIFLRQSDKDTRPFLSRLCSSQMFTQFITDRLLKSCQEPEILVFDEYIKLKLNRSKLKFVKEETPFLNDQSYRVSQIIWATPPNDEFDYPKSCKL